ncbi:hypothetical protein M3Y98_00860900 [Aphelenchoides besseyi]|nr:hypothetical protein M3Y98_00860900 [Aphelenchoides besseyi]KAI6211179.1 hypothetical protein M3Y96_00406400 [Aphelenchoides besseyi]
MSKPNDQHNVHLPVHRVRFENENEYVCCKMVPIRLAVIYVFMIGILESIAAVTLGVLSINYTVIGVYGLIAIFHLILLIGHVSEHPGLYTFYVIGNWALAWISSIFFGLFWFLYYIDNNRWVNPSDLWVWQWIGLPLKIGDRNLILGLSIAFMLNIVVQHCNVLLILRRAYENMVQEQTKE